MKTDPCCLEIGNNTIPLEEEPRTEEHIRTPTPAMTHPNMVNRFHHFSYSMPETPNTSNAVGCFTNHTNQATQTRHTHDTAPFRMTNTSHEQGFYHRGSPRSNHSLYSTVLCEYDSSGLHNSNITTNCLEAIPFIQARAQFMRAVCYHLV